MTDRQSQYRSSGLFELVPIALLGTALSLGFALLLNYLLLFSDALTPFDRSLITAIAVPVVVGAPLSFLLAWAVRSVNRYRRALTKAASYDPATDVLRGNAFCSMVDRRAQSKIEGRSQQGAFLLVDVHGVKAINLRHGLEWGDEALRVVTSTIRASVRSEDFVGRLGTDEFGIFLPGASEDNAREIAQRVLDEVNRVYVARGARSEELVELNVAGIHFETAVGFHGMYRAAEERLLRIERTGVVDVAHIGGIATRPAYETAIH